MKNTMILVDASFAIAWLLGEPKADDCIPSLARAAMPTHQYAETLVFFRKIGGTLEEVSAALSAIDLLSADRSDLQFASLLYLEARRHRGCKASLADAILAALTLRNQATLLSFDQDFDYLGLKEFKNGKWKVKSSK